MSRACLGCGQPIPPERLEAIPDAVKCVPCLKKSGDVALKRGRMVYDHKTAGALEVCSGEQLQRMRELPNNIEERVSRL